MNKIKQEELAKLSELNRSFRDLKFQVADIELSFERLKVQKMSTMAALESTIHDLAIYQERLTDKYGDITINLQTGEYH